MLSWLFNHITVVIHQQAEPFFLRVIKVWVKFSQNWGIRLKTNFFLSRNIFEAHFDHFLSFIWWL